VATAQNNHYFKPLTDHVLLLKKERTLSMKKMIPLMLFGLSIAIVPPVSASPLALSGDVSIKYERDTAAGANNISGTMSTFKLRAEKNLADNLLLYARLGAQQATNPQLADYTIDGAYASDKKIRHCSRSIRCNL
jgi:hypothetical protein